MLEMVLLEMVQQMVMVPKAAVKKKQFKHYENFPMQYTETLKIKKMSIFIRKKLIFFLFLLKTYIVCTR